MPVQNTKAYIAFKNEAERLTNLIALISHAVPVLKRVLASPPATAIIPIKPPDNFPHDAATAQLLTEWTKDYTQDLAHVIVLTVFSQFEAYVRCVLEEIYERQGGAEAFVALAAKHAQRYWISPPATVTVAKHKLSDTFSKSKASKYRKFSKVLVDAGFAFPPDLLAAYGAKQLLKKTQPKNFRAWEIPDLLTDALLLKVNDTEKRCTRTLENFGTTSPTVFVHP